MSYVRSLIFFFLSATAALAQISNATLLGTVTDSSGAVISGATIEVKNLATLATRSATTAGDGEYVIPDLPAAHYSITIKVAGFKTYNSPNVELTVAQQAMVNASLEVGDIGQQVTVASAAPIVETAESSVGQVVNTSAVELMPLIGRNFWQLTNLTPGATYTPGGQGTATGGGSIRATVVNVTINGTAPNMIGWFLDGAFITEMQRGGTMIQPNVDALQEFKVESANTAAEYGHTPNVVNVALKSGTNSLHGTAFEFLRNSAFDARNFFYKPPVGSTQGIEPLRRNQYGFAIGGPIRKDKTFFFADLERTGLLQGIDFNNIVPSLAERGGNFSQLLAGSKPTPILNPANYQPFPGNIIPTSLICRRRNFSCLTCRFNTVQGATSYSAETNNLLEHQIRADMRLDEQISGSTTLMGHYSVNNNDESDPNQYLTMGTYPLHSLAQNATVSLIHIFSPKWINSARVSYYRDYFYFSTAAQGTNVNQEAGVQGFNDTTLGLRIPGNHRDRLLHLYRRSVRPASQAEPDPRSAVCRRHELLERQAQHQVRLRLIHADAGFINGSSAVGIFNFLGTYSGDGFADLLLGYPNSVTRDYFKALNGDYADFPGLYAQDNFRVTENLTVNLGVRLEFNGFYNGIRGQKSAFDPSTGKLVIPSTIDPQVQSLTSSLMQLFSDRIEYTKNVLASPIPSNPRRPIGRRAWASPGGRLEALSWWSVVPSASSTPSRTATPSTTPSPRYRSSPRPRCLTIRRPFRLSRTWGNFFLGQAQCRTQSESRPSMPVYGYVAISLFHADGRYRGHR